MSAVKKKHSATCGIKNIRNENTVFPVGLTKSISICHFKETDRNQKLQILFFFLPELFEVKAVLRPNVFRIVGANTKNRTAAPLEQIQPRNFVNRAPISCEEVIDLKGQIGEAERCLDNSEKLGLTSLQLGEQLRLIDVNKGIEKLLQLKGAVGGYKLKVKAIGIERDWKIQEFCWKILRLHDAQNLFSVLRVALIFY